MTPEHDVTHHHTAAIGAGPSNLSLAALFQAVRPDTIALFDRQEGPAWHPGLLNTGVRMQTSWMKDLVSLVDPCHQLSFMNYLVTTGRVYALLNAQYETIPRLEYVHYLAWASAQLEHLHYGVTVDRVGFDGGFWLYAQDQLLTRSDHLVLGLGTQPFVSTRFAEQLGPTLFVADELRERLPSMSADLAAPVAIVGGGQTGAECVIELLGRGFQHILWFGRRPWFAPIDDSPPANDFYRPAYSRYLDGLSSRTRRRLIEGQVLTGDAITPGMLQAIYQTNYDEMLRTGSFPLRLFAGHDVVAVDPCGEELSLRARAAEGQGEHRVRYVVLATGRQPEPLPFDEGLLGRLDLDDSGDIIVDEDYSVRWKGSNGHRIYAQNRARYRHGLLDANLTQLPVRSALILNSLFEREVFTVRDELVTTVWG